MSEPKTTPLKRRRRTKRWTKKRKIVISACGATILLAAVASYLLFQSTKRAQLLAEAENALTENKKDLALIKTKEAYTLSENHEQTRIKYAKLLIDEDAEQALEILRPHIEEEETAEPAILHLWIQTLLNLDRAEEAFNVAEKLLASDPEDAYALYIVGRVKWKQNASEAAQNMLIEAERKLSDKEEVRYYCALALEDSPNYNERLRAKHLLKGFSANKTPYSLRALKKLVLSQHLPLFDADFKEACQLLNEHPGFAKSLKSDDDDSLRRLSQIATSYHRAVAFKAAQELLTRDSVQPGDKANFITLGQLVGEHERVEPVLKELTEKFPQVNYFHVLKARQALIQEDFEKAIVLFNVALKKDPANKDALATLFSISATQEFNLTVSQKIQILELVIAHPAATPEQLTFAYQKLLQLRPTRQKEIVEQAIEALKEKAPAQLARWLNASQQFELTLKHFNDESANQESDLLLAKAYACIQQKSYADLEQLLETSKTKLAPIDYTLLKAQYAHIREDKAEARTNWEQCYQLATAQKSPNHFISLSRINIPGIDLERRYLIFRRALEWGGRLQEGDWVNYINVLVEKQDYDRVLRISKEAITLFPHNLSLKNFHYYLSLLRGIEVKENTAAAEEIVTNNSNEISYRITLALGYYKQGKIRDALKVVEETRLDLSKEGAEGQAVYAAILAAHGRNELATSIARNIDQSRLIKEERFLIEPLLATQAPVAQE